MNLKFLWLSVFSGLLCIPLAQAQDTSSAYRVYTIIDALLSDELSDQGTIRIQTDAAITALIGLPMNSFGVTTDEQEFVKASGYRVQAFSGNDPRRSKSEAFYKEREVKELFPEVSTYVTYASPNWRLRIGDFRTKEEAIVFIQNLKKAFPDFGKEMYPVVDKIRVPLEKKN